MNNQTSKVLSTRGRRTRNLWPETGRLLGLGKNATYKAARKGEIPILRIGGRLLVPIDALDRLLQVDNNTKATAPADPDEKLPSCGGETRAEHDTGLAAPRQVVGLPAITKGEADLRNNLEKGREIDERLSKSAIHNTASTGAEV